MRAAGGAVAPGVWAATKHLYAKPHSWDSGTCPHAVVVAAHSSAWARAVYLLSCLSGVLGRATQSPRPHPPPFPALQVPVPDQTTLGVEHVDRAARGA